MPPRRPVTMLDSLKVTVQNVVAGLECTLGVAT
jgi:hypothetical protein